MEFIQNPHLYFYLFFNFAHLLCFSLAGVSVLFVYCTLQIIGRRIVRRKKIKTIINVNENYFFLERIETVDFWFVVSPAQHCLQELGCDGVS